jgi:hypothetical protein
MMIKNIKYLRYINSFRFITIQLVILIFGLLLLNSRCYSSSLNLRDQNPIKVSGFNENSDQDWFDTWGTSACGYGVTVDLLDNIYMTGYYNKSVLDGYDVFLLKYNTSGTRIWNVSWGGLDKDVGYGVITDPLGNIYVVGETFSFGEGSSDVFLVKFNPLGDQLWNLTWGGPDIERSRNVATDSSGNVFITGWTESYGLGSTDGFLVKFDSSGTQIWNTTWGDADEDLFIDLAIDPLGDIYVTGYNESYIYSNPIFHSIIVKYDSLGTKLWDLNLLNVNPFMEAITLDLNNNIYLAGDRASYTSNLCKLNSSGGLIWYKTWSGINDALEDYSHEIVRGIAIDTFGSIYIVGYSDIYGDSRDTVFLLKYDSVNGDFYGYGIWNQSLTYDEKAFDIAIDSFGSTYVTGCMGGTSFLVKNIFIREEQISPSNPSIPSFSEFSIIWSTFTILILIIYVKNSVLVDKKRDRGLK